MATSRTWIDSTGNHRAGDPLNWSPNGAPQPGDTLLVTHAALGDVTPPQTLDISGRDLAGDSLGVDHTFGAPVQINTNHAQPLQLGLVFASDVNLHVQGTTTVNLSVMLSNLNTSGGTLRFIGSDRLLGAGIYFGSDLTGSAAFNIVGGAGEGSHIEFNGHVGRGLTFDLSAGLPVISMQIDQPRQFEGVIELRSGSAAPPPFSYVAFMGLHATSANLHNDMLQMFDGHNLVDTVRISGGEGFHLQLQQNSAGVILSAGFPFGAPGGAGTPIPLHIAG